MREGNSWQIATQIRQPLAIGLVLSVAGHAVALLSFPRSEVAAAAVGGSAKTMHVALRAAATANNESLNFIPRSSVDGGNPKGTETSVPGFPAVDRPISRPFAVDVEYFPSVLLAQGPAVLDTVDILRPETDLENAAVMLYLNLFINEHGLVDRVEVDDAGRHPTFAEAAIGAFRNARFSPGQRHGRAVKSLMRIEVLFEPVDRSAQRE